MFSGYFGEISRFRLFYSKRQYIFRHYNYSSKITLQLLHCDKIRLLMIKKQQSNLPYFTALFHVITIHMTLKEMVPVIYDDSMVVDQRFIYLKLEDNCSRKKCTLKLGIDPLSTLPQFSLFPDEGNICQIGYKFLGTHVIEHLECPLLNKRKTYFVVYGRFDTSWIDTKNTCRLLGATLPSILSWRDSDLLSKLLLRSSKLSSSSYTHARCRHFDPICGIFIGLKGNKVCKNLFLDIISV